MWYPTKLQWFVIWMTTVTCLIFWLASNPEPDRLLRPFVLIGALFVWQVSQGERTGSDE